KRPKIMRSRFPIMRLLAPAFLLLLFLHPAAARAQEDDSSLGDLARKLRQDRSQQQSQPSDSTSTVIDNDNLTQVMEDAKNARPLKSDKTVFSIDAASNSVKVSSPDVTCSLSFNARSSALLIRPVLVEDLPQTELLKIDGPGSIQDENLQLDVFNGTDWDLREITIGLTLERKPGENAEVAARARIIPAAENSAPVVVERRSDVTLLYHLKASAKPFSTTTFRENIGITPGPDEDWRWSIVEAKGIRPTPASAAPDSLQEPLFAMPSSLLPAANEPQLAPIVPTLPDKPAQPQQTSDKPASFDQARPR
ncbi:MAG: hypothetical protein WAK23_09565, partial [Terriglobales bacterium]